MLIQESFKKFLDSNPEADDLQNLISSSLSTVLTAVKFSWRSSQFSQRCEPTF